MSPAPPVFLHSTTGTTLFSTQFTGSDSNHYEHKTHRRTIEKPFDEEGAAGRLRVAGVCPFSKKDIVAAAKNYIGVPYSAGGFNNTQMGASGLFQRAMLDLGVYIAYYETSTAYYPTCNNYDTYCKPQYLYNLLKKETTKSPQAGDVAFFFYKYKDKSYAAHMGILTDGKGGMIHASRTDGRVTIVENYKTYYSPGCWENILTCKTDSLYPSPVFVDPVF